MYNDIKLRLLHIRKILQNTNEEHPLINANTVTQRLKIPIALLCIGN